MAPWSRVPEMPRRHVRCIPRNGHGPKGPLGEQTDCTSHARFRGHLNGHSSWAAGGLAAALARTPLGQGGYANPATLPRLLPLRACDPRESVS